ncbi:hypothetical protein M409DRAFT_67634 [Zasmidium cellare ATCC 36951]|uniref:Major facilitator superfamily (MFS) profile domain-containing protein n=1 Tax=Zasmidium cellare ATCC 36951 TaxID=1080233 RepID=A0A6A6CD20_ZASCE|nr:uncharacterized protein M409DRAFT_67634 [Zasmidium cellare ATCC 36951]KAF2164941.1 hypothetical protein M409DRAFT_67634 [Zasmidium cellare ATCC 36951]
MATTTATAVELETINQDARPSLTSTATVPSRGYSHQQYETNLDDIAEASRVADAGVPEGGYGWVVTICSGILAFLSIGFSYSWGVIQQGLIDEGFSSAQVLPWVGSLCVAMVAISAIVNARVLRSLGSQRTSLLGVVLVAIGQLTSGFSTRNIAGLFVAAGVVTGQGLSLCFMVSATITSQYFNRKRGLATGLIYAAGGAGGAANSFILDALIKSVGTAWSFRIVALITLAMGLPAAFFIRDRIAPNRRTFIDWTLFRDPRFFFLFLCGVVATFPLLVPPFFLPLYSVSIGMPGAAAALVAGFNLASAVGRIIFGYCCDKIGSLNSLFMTLILVALSMLSLWPVSQSLGPLIAFVVINGAACGGFFSVFPTVAGSVFGSARVSVAMGMLVTGWSGGYLLGAPIAGYLLADYGGASAGFKAYRPAIYYAGSMALGAAGLVALVRLRMNKKMLAKV